jgi:hypothetical protein
MTLSPYGLLCSTVGSAMSQPQWAVVAHQCPRPCPVLREYTNWYLIDQWISQILCHNHLHG